MKAQQLFRYKACQGVVILEMVLWKIPIPTSERPHELKYRLYCGRKRECIVRYDNEAGKGDHRHYGNQEIPYNFQSLDKLLADFRDDCTRLANWRWT